MGLLVGRDHLMFSLCLPSSAYLSSFLASGGNLFLRENYLLTPSYATWHIGVHTPTWLIATCDMNSKSTSESFGLLQENENLPSIKCVSWSAKARCAIFWRQSLGCRAPCGKTLTSRRVSTPHSALTEWVLPPHVHIV